MWLRLRQICLVARDLERVTEDLRAVFDLEVCYVDSHVGKYGLENRLLPIGNQLLEIVAPTTGGTAAGRYLERRGGDGGYMVITQCDDHAPRKRRVAELGVRVANAIDRNGFHGMQLHPKDTGGAFFEIDYQEGGAAPDGPWEPAGPGWREARRTEVVDAMPAAELQSPEPERLARRWAEIAQLPLTRNRAGHAQIELENARLRFVEATDGRGEGLGGIDVRTRDPSVALARAQRRGCPIQPAGPGAADAPLVTVCGTRFRLVPAGE